AEMDALFSAGESERPRGPERHRRPRRDDRRARRARRARRPDGLPARVTRAERSLEVEMSRTGRGMNHRMPWGCSLSRMLGAALVLALSIEPTLAHAQEDESKRAAARILATDGLRAFEEGRWDAAIDQFQRAEALVHAPPHLLYVARALAKQGKLAKAN